MVGEDQGQPVAEPLDHGPVASVQVLHVEMDDRMRVLVPVVRPEIRDPEPVEPRVPGISEVEIGIQHSEAQRFPEPAGPREHERPGPGTGKDGIDELRLIHIAEPPFADDPEVLDPNRYPDHDCTHASRRYNPGIMGSGSMKGVFGRSL